jgi:hypothetical protein
MTRCESGFLVFLIVSSIMQAGCGYRYANVYIKTVLKNSHTAVSMDAYSGRDGLHLGETLTPIPIKKRARKRYPPLSIVVRGGVDGCPTYWQIVNVANWGKSPQEAADASKKNEVLFIIDDKDAVCTR